MKKQPTSYLTSRVVFLLAASLGVFLFLLIALLLCRDTLQLYIVPVALLLLALLVVYFVRYILLPYREIQKTMILFASGYTYDAPLEQRHYFCPAEEQMIRRFSEIVNRNTLLDISKKQAEYLALQNQINPHFLYNTLESIRGEAMASGLDDLANMTEAMAKFFRYSIFNVNHLVHLEEELMNIENYFRIQHYRFGDKLNLVIESPPEDTEAAYRCLMPKMTLQPIVENAVYHGIEPKLGTGTLRIRIELTQERLIVTVSDDGLGMEPEKRDALNQKLSMISIDEIQSDKPNRNGIALINVNTRIKLLFGEAYGLHIFSSPNVGTDVVVTLPLHIEGGTADAL